MHQPLRWMVAAIVSVSALVAGTMPGHAQTTATGRVQPPALLAFSDAWNSISGYSTKVTVYDEKDGQVQNVVFAYTFDKPTTMTVKVLTGSNAGVSLAWSGGPTMTARKGSGLLAMFKKTISLHDPMASTLRGASLDQLSFGAILKHGQETAGSIVQGSYIDLGIPVDALTIHLADPAKNVGLTDEIVELSKETHLPVRVIGFVGTKMVRSIEFTDVKLKR